MPCRWRAIFDAEEPHTVPLGEPWANELTPFQRLLVRRILRSAGATLGLQRRPNAALSSPKMLRLLSFG